MQTISTDEIREHYSNRNGPAHWFSPSTLRFFRSRISEDAYQAANGRTAYFVTSEQFDWKSPRLYTVRRYSYETREIDTIGAFQAYASRSGAHAAAKRMATTGRVETTLVNI